MFGFFRVPEGGATMGSKAVEGADFGEGAEFVFVQADTGFEIFHGSEGLFVALFEELESVIGLEALDHAEAEAEGGFLRIVNVGSLFDPFPLTPALSLRERENRKAIIIGVGQIREPGRGGHGYRIAMAP